jgi:hypothetical protein
MACAMMTDAGTLYSRKLCIAGAATRLKNTACSAVRPAFGAGTTGGVGATTIGVLHLVGVLMTLVTYECDT